MKKLLLLTSVALLAACSQEKTDDLDLTSKFKTTWNLYETVEHNSDGTITYHAQPWGGLVADFKERNMPVDWTKYESITVEFAKTTESPTQIMVSDGLRTWGKPGIKTLTCNFDGQNVTSVGEVAIQSADTATLYVKRVYLTLGGAVWDSTPIWKGHCALGNWENGFVVGGDQFMTAYKGDKLEIVFKADQSDPNREFWQLKTIYNSTDSTLEGNESELNSWGCATVGKETTSYRITLTEKDITTLREKGLFVNGYYNIVTQCNLLRRNYVQEEN